MKDWKNLSNEEIKKMIETQQAYNIAGYGGGGPGVAVIAMLQRELDRRKKGEIMDIKSLKEKISSPGIDGWKLTVHNNEWFFTHDWYETFEIVATPCGLNTIKFILIDKVDYSRARALDLKVFFISHKDSDKEFRRLFKKFLTKKAVKECLK